MTTAGVAVRKTVDVLALGVVVRIQAVDRELRAAIERAWEPCLVSDAVEAAATVTTNVPALDDPEALSKVLRQLTQDVTAAAIRARAGSLMMFHAGGLSNQETGAALAFVAPGGTGKTTVVRTLGPGRGYITDETVGVSSDGCITPYCKPLSIRRYEGFLRLKDETRPADLGLSVPRTQPWLAGVVVLRRDLESGAPIEVVPVDLLDAIALLAPETSSLAAIDAPLHTLARLLESVGGLRVVRYHDACDLEPVVADVLGRSR